MKRNILARRPILKTVGYGLSLLLICILICFFHIYDIQNTFEDEAFFSLKNQFDTVTEILDTDTERLSTATVSLANQLVICETEEERLKNASALVLEYETAMPEFHFAYVNCANHMAYYSDREASGLSILEYLSSQGKDERHVICTQTDMWIENNERIPTITIIHPIQVDDEIVGYALGFHSYKNEFKAVKYMQLLKCGECFMINGDGKIIGTSLNADELRKGSVDFFTRLFNESDQSAKTKKLLVGTKSKMAVNRTGNIEYLNAYGQEQRVMYRRVEGSEDAYFFVVYEPDLMLNRVEDILFRSLIACMAIIVFLIGMIAVVWVSSKRSQQVIEELAFGDKVTGGKNMNYFQQKALEIITGNPETPFLLYRFDILNFRYINEAYGHIKADKVLAACVQEFDRHFGAKELCARINSDQFMALIMNDATVTQRWQSFDTAVGEAARMAGVRYPIRLKTGIYQIRKGDINIAVMIDHANVARKSLTGDEKVLETTYSDSIIATMHKVDKIETDMQAALANGEFKLYLQPKWDIYNNKIAGAEALVRWIKPDGVIVQPGDFVPIFEKNGFIEKLDYYMLESVCRMLHELDCNPEEYNQYPVSVNQSRLLINNPDYVKNVEKIINKYNTPIPMLELEITETVFFSERNKMIEIMNQLKDLGLTLSMDDFGSGYSSLNVLKDIPFDILKIDREFFSESVTSESSIWIMEKIIEMAKGLGIKSICEGVEKEEQVEILKKIGCGMAQGFYYSKPMPMHEYLDKYCVKRVERTKKQ